MKDIYPFFVFLANCATVFGIVVALCGAWLALKTYISNNSIRKYELIDNIFDIFMKDGRYEFYKKIHNGEQINLESNEEEKLLNEALTMFDALNYFQTQGLLDYEAWEYFACEIQNFALNNSVGEYIDKIKEQYQARGFPEVVIPFTGFPELVKKLPNKFKARCPQQLKKQFNELLLEEQNFYYGKVKYIPGRQLQQHAAAIVLDKAKGGPTGRKI